MFFFIERSKTNNGCSFRSSNYKCKDSYKKTIYSSLDTKLAPQKRILSMPFFRVAFSVANERDLGDFKSFMSGNEKVDETIIVFS